MINSSSPALRSKMGIELEESGSGSGVGFLTPPTRPHPLPKGKAIFRSSAVRGLAKVLLKQQALFFIPSLIDSEGKLCEFQ